MSDKSENTRDRRRVIIGIVVGVAVLLGVGVGAMYWGRAASTETGGQTGVSASQTASARPEFSPPAIPSAGKGHMSSTSAPSAATLRGQISFVYAPSAAVVRIDGRAVVPPTNRNGTVAVDAGQHQVEISMGGFATYATSVTVKAGTSATVMAGLEPNSAVTTDWYLSHFDDQQTREYIGGLYADEEQDKIDKYLPVWKVLPIGAPGILADYEPMSNAKGGSGYGIAVTCDLTIRSMADCRSIVEYDIRDAGYNPSEYTIQYRSGSVPEPTW